MNLHRPAILVFAAAAWLHAEQGVMVVQVEDFKKGAIPHLQLRAEGGPPAAPTDDGGLARLYLDKSTKPGQWVTLYLVKPPGDLVFLSPFDQRTLVPPFDSATEVHLVVTSRGDLELLRNPAALESLAANALKKFESSANKSVALNDHQRREALAEVAKTYGLQPEDLDKAIRAWGQTTEDPYQKGLADLYAKKYPQASAELQKTLETSEVQLDKMLAKVSATAFYLGQSLYAQGRFREAAAAFQKAANIRTDDPTVLSNLGVSLEAAGEYGQAEPYLRRALQMRQAALGPDDPNTAASIDNLGGLLEDEGNYAGAETLYRQALAIRENKLGPDNPDTATSVYNLAGALDDKGDYAGAEPLYRRALAIRKDKLGPEHPDTASSLDDLGGLLERKGDYAGAGPLFREALEIRQKVLGPEHPDTATSLDHIGGLLQDQDNFAEAEQFYRKALAIRDKVLGPDHPDTAVSLDDLAGLLVDKRDYAGAEPLYRRALAIREKTLGANHLDTASSLSHLAELLELTGNREEALALYRRTLEIREKVLGPDSRPARATRKRLDALTKKPI